MGHGAWGMGHGAWGMGHGAWGMGHRAWGIGHGACLRYFLRGDSAGIKKPGFFKITWFLVGPLKYED
jgi:hypothetical protein